MAELREHKKEIQREEILKNAKNCFWTSGFEKTSMGEIARKSSVAVGTIYNYYESKEALFVEVLRLGISNNILQLAKNRSKPLVKENSNIIEELLETLKIFLEPFKELPKKDVRILVDCIIGGPYTNDTYKVLRNWYQNIEKGFLKRILSKYNLENHNIKNCDEDVLLEIISGMILVNYKKHLNQGISYSDFESNLKVQLEFLFRI